MKPGNNIPILWRKFLSNIATNSDYIHNHCDNPFNRFHRHCHEWYLYNLMKNNTEMGYNDNFEIIQV